MQDSTVVTGQVYRDETGIAIEVPILLTKNGPVDFLLDYFVENRDARSTEWMRQVTFSIKLFLQYLEVHKDYSNARDIFQNFRHRLLTGTINLTVGEDLSGLWWSARSPKQSSRIIFQISEFFDWINKSKNIERSIQFKSSSGEYNQRLNAAAFNYKRNKEFLGHTWSSFEEASKNPNNKSFINKWYSAPKTEKDKPYAFPEDCILDLIMKGFKVGDRYNYRDMLITLLLNGAGFRVSEPFHLYLWDVCEDPKNKGSALVLIHHPSYGNAPLDPAWVDIFGRQRYGNREQYLSEHYGIKPRHRELSKASAGWKGGMHENKYGGYYKQAYWFIPEFGKMFWEIWNIYIEQIQRIPIKNRFHPFAFVNNLREPYGGVYKLSKFEKSHAAAVRRIGLVPAKNLGTSIHGHRHAYGQRLRKASVPKEMIRRFMHHSDIESQDIYTQAEINECLEHIEIAISKLNAKSLIVQSEINKVFASNKFK